MNIEQRKAKLLAHSANEVRNDKSLFAEFVYIYVEEGGSARSCHGCLFKSTFTNWQRQNNITKTLVMSNSKNTFKLINPNQYIYIPGPGKFAGEVITKDAPDEYVEAYLNQVKGKEKENRIQKNFSELPMSMRPKKKASKKEEVAPAPEIKLEPASEIEKLSTEYKEKFNKEVPNRYKNDLDWIANRLGKA